MAIYVLEEGAEGGGAGDAFPGGLKEDGVWRVERQEGSSGLVRRSWTQASRILVRVARVEAWGAAEAVGEKVGARMVAKPRNAMAARREQGNSRNLAGDVEGRSWRVLSNRNLPFLTSNTVAILHSPAVRDGSLDIFARGLVRGRVMRDETGC